MTLRRSSAIVALSCVVLFSLLSLFKVFTFVEDRLYDFFLRFRIKKDRIESVLFLDVDDLAVSQVGVYPWPRSVIADAFLRLKEYGADRVILDIEFVDKSPDGVDETYKNQGLPADFNRSFSTISAYVEEFTGALVSGTLSRGDASLYAGELLEAIEEERGLLLEKAGSIARDNDIYLAQTAGLFGSVWSTLNFQNYKLEGDQSARKKVAEELFSYPITVRPGAHSNTNEDLLPPIVSLMEASAGAGFTNVVIDSDGVRRRILLTRELDGLWYLQLAFAPLADFLGRPEMILEKNRLTLKGVMLGEEKKRDIVIPLDNSGAMLLDWPLETYDSSFTHVSFAVFSRLENLEQQILGYLNNLSDSDYRFFGDTMNVARNALQYLDAAQEARRRAVTQNSDEAFDEFLSLQEEGRRQVKALLESGVAVREAAEVRDLAESIPAGSRERLLEEADYMATSAEYLGTVYAGLEEIDRRFREILPGKFCIAGRVDTGTTDIGVNPFHEQYVNVGTHGVVLDTIQRESFIIPLDRIWSLLLAILFAPVLIVLLSSLKPLFRFIIGFIGAVILFAASLLLLGVFGIFLDPLVPGLSLFAAVIIREVVAFMNSEQEKQFIRKALSTYTSPAVADVIIQNPSLFTLGGDRRNMTAIFTDIRSFSTISEALKNPETGEADPRRLVNLLNVYLTRMSDIVLDNQGTIDKYEGDAIIAFFGAPLPMDDHAFLACRSAIAMRKAEVDFNREARERELIDDAVLQALVNKGIIKSKDDPSPIMTRIGINTGNMVVGNMGTENKMNYTIMGNAVNLAARLEGVNKQYGTVILTSGNTIRETGDKILSRRLDRVRVVGITEPVRLHELIDLNEAASGAETEMVRLFHEALEIFEAKDWTAAKENFLKVLNMAPEDNPSAMYLSRCEKFRQTPPAHDWDGIFNLNEK